LSLSKRTLTGAKLNEDQSSGQSSPTKRQRVGQPTMQKKGLEAVVNMSEVNQIKTTDSRATRKLETMYLAKRQSSGPVTVSGGVASKLEVVAEEAPLDETVRGDLEPLVTSCFSA
jgi:hypothetical protein